MRADVWIFHARREVLVTDLPGPPVDASGHLGPFELPECGWGEAGRAGEAKAEELGYKVRYECGSCCE